jgi:hypothetical protein
MFGKISAELLPHPYRVLIGFSRSTRAERLGRRERLARSENDVKRLEVKVNSFSEPVLRGSLIATSSFDFIDRRVKEGK